MCPVFFYVLVAGSLCAYFLAVEAVQFARQCAVPCVVGTCLRVAGDGFGLPLLCNTQMSALVESEVGQREESMERSRLAQRQQDQEAWLAAEEEEKQAAGVGADAKHSLQKSSEAATPSSASSSSSSPTVVTGSPRREFLPFACIPLHSSLKDKWITGRIIKTSLRGYCSRPHRAISSGFAECLCNILRPLPSPVSVRALPSRVLPRVCGCLSIRCVARWRDAVFLLARHEWFLTFLGRLLLLAYRNGGGSGNWCGIRLKMGAALQGC